MKTPPPSRLHHESILASAGTGKTYQLVIRFLRLIANQQSPRRIIALTFTRKAAAEFFERIVTRLTEAAESEEKAAQLAQQLGLPDFTAAQARVHLRTVIEAMPHLLLSTYDSFFQRLIRLFPFEFGLPGGFSLVEETQRQTQQLQLLEKMMCPQQTVYDAESQRLLREFELLSLGSNDTRVFALINNVITDYHGQWLLQNSESAWSGLAMLRESQEEVLRLGQVTDAHRDAWISLIINECRQQEEKETKRLETLEKHLVSLCAHPTDLSGKLSETLLENTAEHFATGEPTSGFSFTYSRKTYELSLAAARAWWQLGRTGALTEISQSMAKMQTIYHWLSRYQQLYDQAFLAQGQLTFGDIQWLTSQYLPRLGETSSIIYRCDGAYDHWLIDEFQDTSRPQWQAIENLVDEVICDPSGQRTYFQVGDAKQSIYGWRGADSSLFDELRERYGLLITERSLTETWRSQPEVISLVNTLCGATDIMRRIFPPEAVTRWEKIYTPQQTAAAVPRLPAVAALVRPIETDDDSSLENAKQASWATIEEIIRTQEPIARGLSIAVLYRTNTKARQFSAWLKQRPGLPPVICESETAPITDNIYTLTLLSLLQVAAHPGDTMALQQVQMSPLAPLWPAAESARWAQELRSHILTHGLAETLMHCAARIKNELDLPVQDFSRSRFDDWLALARQFDEKGDRDLNAFITSSHQARQRDVGLASAIQVMTVHKAKGLEFDLVFIPLEAGEYSVHSPSFWIKKNSHHIESYLYPPSTKAMRFLPEFHALDTETRAQQHFEQFCAFYVALTRARRALYLIAPESKKHSTEKNILHFVNQTLTHDKPTTWPTLHHELSLAWHVGQPDWHLSVPKLTEKITAPEARQTLYHPNASAGRRRHPRQTPSGSESHVLNIDHLLSSQSTPATERGRWIHAAFEQIQSADDLYALEKWWTTQDQNRWQQEWQLVQLCLKNRSFRAALSLQPDERCWRELPFEIILHGSWTSGVIDRYTQRADGTFIITDFKTDDLHGLSEAAIAEKIAGYAPQLSIYRQVITQRHHCPAERVHAQLLFTHDQSVRPVAFT